MKKLFYMNSETIIFMYEWLVYRRRNEDPETFWLDWCLQKLAEVTAIND